MGWRKKGKRPPVDIRGSDKGWSEPFFCIFRRRETGLESGFRTLPQETFRIISWTRIAFDYKICYNSDSHSTIYCWSFQRGGDGRHEDHQEKRLGSGVRHRQNCDGHHQGERGGGGERPHDADADQAHFGKRGAGLRATGTFPQRGGGPGHGGAPDHGPRSLRGGQGVYHLSVYPLPGPPVQHHRRQDPQPHRVQQRGGQAGEFQ